MILDCSKHDDEIQLTRQRNAITIKITVTYDISQRRRESTISTDTENLSQRERLWLCVYGECEVRKRGYAYRIDYRAFLRDLSLFRFALYASNVSHLFSPLASRVSIENVTRRGISFLVKKLSRVSDASMPIINLRVSNREKLANYISEKLLNAFTVTAKAHSDCYNFLMVFHTFSSSSFSFLTV